MNETQELGNCVTRPYVLQVWLQNPCVGVATQSISQRTVRVYSADMPATIFGPDIFVVLIFLLLAIGMPIWTLVDILFRRPEVFAVTHLSKTTWVGLTMGLVLVALFIPLLRIVTAGFCLNYLIRVRPKLKFRDNQ